jgi:hypothetical protein
MLVKDATGGSADTDIIPDCDCAPEIDISAGAIAAPIEPRFLSDPDADRVTTWSPEASEPV